MVLVKLWICYYFRYFLIKMMNVVVILSILSVCMIACDCTKIKFYLYQNGESSQTLTLREEDSDPVLFNQFDSSLPTHMYFHGTFGSLAAPKEYCSKLLETGDFNCIVVEWSAFDESDQVSHVAKCHFLKWCTDARIRWKWNYVLQENTSANKISITIFFEFKINIKFHFVFMQIRKLNQT